MSNFENVTRTIISDEIEGSRREEMLALEEEIKELSAQLHSLEDSIRDQNIHITDTFGPYLGNEFLEPDRLSELSKLIQSGSAANITEAITLYKAGSQKRRMDSRRTIDIFKRKRPHTGASFLVYFREEMQVWGFGFVYKVR